MRKTFIKTINQLAQKDDNIYIISGDAGFGVFEEYQEQYPDRFINCGVAEANTIGYAAGLALRGFNVFVYNIIPFILYRCFEQVRNDICYQRLPITLIGIGSGVTYAPGGMTHYSVEDLALCQALPNLTVISPIDPVETAAAVRYAAQAKEPVYIRLAKSGEANIHANPCQDIRQPTLVRDGQEIAILTYGSIAPEMIQAADILAQTGIFPRLLSVPTLQPFPGQQLCELCADCHTIITLEEHFASGGLASRMLTALHHQERRQRLIPCALPDKFIHDINTCAGIRQKYSLDAAALVQLIKNLPITVN